MCEMRPGGHAVPTTSLSVANVGAQQARRSSATTPVRGPQHCLADVATRVGRRCAARRAQLRWLRGSVMWGTQPSLGPASRAPSAPREPRFCSCLEANSGRFDRSLANSSSRRFVNFQSALLRFPLQLPPTKC